MVAEPRLILVAIIGAERLHATVLRVFLKQEGSVVDVGTNLALKQGGRHQHMVYLLPKSLIAIVGTRAMGSLSVGSSTDESMFQEKSHGLVLESGIEVACHEDKGIGRPSTYAPTITTIMTRGYISREKKRLHPTELGMVITDMSSCGSDTRSITKGRT